MRSEYWGVNPEPKNVRKKLTPMGRYCLRRFLWVTNQIDPCSPNEATCGCRSRPVPGRRMTKAVAILAEHARWKCPHAVSVHLFSLQLKHSQHSSCDIVEPVLCQSYRCPCKIRKIRRFLFFAFPYVVEFFPIPTWDPHSPREAAQRANLSNERMGTSHSM